MDATSIKDLLGPLLTHLNLPFSDIVVGKEEEGGFTRIDIVSEAPSRIIGWHGETLNSIQHILKAIIRTKESLDRAPFIVLDVDNYRREQEDKVKKMAEQKADFVRRTGNRIALPPMSPYFRRIVHMHVTTSKDLQDLTTESAGEGDYRQVVMRLKSQKTPEVGQELSPIIEDAPKKGEGFDNLDV